MAMKNSADGQNCELCQNILKFFILFPIVVPLILTVLYTKCGGAPTEEDDHFQKAINDESNDFENIDKGETNRNAALAKRLAVIEQNLKI